MELVAFLSLAATICGLVSDENFTVWDNDEQKEPTQPGLLPPMAGWEWQSKQLKALKDGPRPLINLPAVPELSVPLTLAGVSKTLRPSNHIANRLPGAAKLRVAPKI
jgi:hypothetical protein